MSDAPWRLLRASWAAVEPRRGDYDAVALGALRAQVVASRRRGEEPVLVLHAGGLPDWVIARGGWLDPDAVSAFGCYVEALGRQLGELTRFQVATWAPMAEAALYGAEQRVAARALVDAQSAAHTLLARSPGHGGRPLQVGVAERFARWVGEGLRGRAEAALRERWGPERLVEVLCSGRLGPPFALAGELQDGQPAADFVLVEWRGRRRLPGERADGEDAAGLAATLRRLGVHERPLWVLGGGAAAIAEARAAGVRVSAVA